MTTPEQAQQHFKELLLELGTAVGIEGLEPDDEGLCLLEIAGDVFVEIACDEETGNLVLASELGTIPDAMAAAWYPQLLEANAFWVGTGGATLGVHQATGQVVQCYQEPLREMSGEHFVQLFEGFTDAARQWKQRILEDPNAEQESQPQDSLQQMISQRV